MTVTYQSNQTLKILEAFARIKQRTIVLKFDNNIQCTNNFEDIFEPLLNITDIPKITCKGKQDIKFQIKISSNQNKLNKNVIFYFAYI